MSVINADAVLHEDPAESALGGITIPVCPHILTELRAEMSRENPDIRRITTLISGDIALSVAVLRIVNSAAYALPRQVGNIAQAVSMIGLSRLTILVTNALIRTTLNLNHAFLEDLWAESAARAHWMSALARRLKCIDVDTAYSLGLLCDLGIPLLVEKFKDYGDIYKLARELNVGIPLLRRQFPMMADSIGNASDECRRQFTEVEFEKYGVEHAQIGAMMARAWGLDVLLADAIRRHHDYSVFWDKKCAPATAVLVAMCLVAEFAMHRSGGGEATSEWELGGESALALLGWRECDLNDWVQDRAEEG